MTTNTLEAHSEGLARYLSHAMPGDGPVSITIDTDGHANEMFFVRRGNDEWVLRRPPENPLLPTVLDVGREYRLLEALSGAGARVPRPLLFCDDTTIIGAPFYLMEKVAGVVVRDHLPAALDNDADRRRIGEELVDTLAELHAVDWRSAGLGDFGKPDGYVDRMLRRWTQRFREVTPLTRPLPELEEVTAWLHANRPPDRPHTIIHGDFHLLNVAFAVSSPARLVAIFDLEVATIGDPLVDLGWLLAFWSWPDDPDGMPMALLNLSPGGLAQVFQKPGWLTASELIDRYATAAGCAVDDVRFYRVLAMWRMALITEARYARHLQAGGDTESEFAALEAGVPNIARRALRLTSEPA